jgi:ribosomal protein S13
METEKLSINQATKLFSISRTTLYTYLKKLKIFPHKQGRTAYLTEQQIAHIKSFIHKNSTTYSAQPEQVEQINHNAVIEKTYIEKIKRLEKKLESEQQENKQLALQLGQWQGRAKTLEEQNQKLLTLHPAKPQKWGFFQSIFSKK